MADMKTSQHIEVAEISTWADAAMTIAAPVDGPIVWASSDETVIKPAPDGTGTHGFVEAVAPNPLDGAGNPIPARITLTADADTGAGVTEITGVSEDIFVTADPAKAGFFKVTLGAATPKA